MTFPRISWAARLKGSWLVEHSYSLSSSTSLTLKVIVFKSGPKEEKLRPTRSRLFWAWPSLGKKKLKDHNSRNGFDHISQKESDHNNQMGLIATLRLNTSPGWFENIFQNSEVWWKHKPQRLPGFLFYPGVDKFLLINVPGNVGGKLVVLLNIPLKSEETNLHQLHSPPGPVLSVLLNH